MKGTLTPSSRVESLAKGRYCARYPSRGTGVPEGYRQCTACLFPSCPFRTTCLVVYPRVTLQLVTLDTVQYPKQGKARSSSVSSRYPVHACAKRQPPLPLAQLYSRATWLLEHCTLVVESKSNPLPSRSELPAFLHIMHAGAPTKSFPPIPCMPSPRSPFSHLSLTVRCRAVPTR